MKARRIIWDENQLYLAEWKRRFIELGNNKEQFIKHIGDNNYTIERFLEIDNKEQKKLFIHYFTTPTLLRALMLEDSDQKSVIVEYITRDFPLIYERMVRYVTVGKLPYSLLEGAFRTFGAGFAKSVLEHIDYSAEEEPFVVGNLIKAQKKAQVRVFKFELVSSFFLYKSSGALRKRDISDIIEAIKSLNEEKTRSILAARFDMFKKKLIKKATDGEVGADYVASQIEKQLNDFCRQISLFDFEGFK